MSTDTGEIGRAARPRRFLRIAAVCDRTGLPPSTVYQFMADGTFPMSIPLGPKIKAWLEEEVEAWQEARMAQRKTGKGAF